MTDAKSEQSAEETVKQILEDPRRSFNFEDPESGEILEYFIGDPCGADIRKADWQYSKIFNQALADSFPTQAQMLEELTKRDIVGDHFNKEVEEVRIGLAAALFRLENIPAGHDDAEKEGAAIEVAESREKLFRLNQKVNGPMGNTCENLAEDARNEYLTSRVIENREGKKIWETFDSYLVENNTALTVKSRFEVMLWLQGLDSNFLESTPEQVALRTLAEKRLSSVLSPEEHKKAVDALPDVEDVELTVEEEKPVKPKKARKPRAKKVVAKADVDKSVPKKRGRPRKKKEDDPKED